MENEKYNGWANRDTWLVALWLDNDQRNYVRMIRMVKGIGTNKKTKELTDKELLDKLKGFYYGDKINWNCVNISELREILLNEEEYTDVDNSYLDRLISNY